MKKELILTILTFLVLVSGLMGFQKLHPAKNNSQQDSIDEASKHASIMLELRNWVLRFTPDSLGLNVSSDEEVYGVIMDWHLTHRTITLTSFKDGGASIYSQVGQSFMGGGEKIGEAAKKYVHFAQSCLADAVRTDSTPLPGNDGVNFYLLTTKGIFTKQLTYTFLQNTSSSWRELFNEANNVIHEYDLGTRTNPKRK